MTGPVTVLGATGYLGSAVAAALASHRGGVRLVGRDVAGLPLPAAGRQDIRVLPLDRPGAVAEAVEGSDLVVHLVAELGAAGAWRDRAGEHPAEPVDLVVLRELVEVARTRRPARPLGLVFASTAVLNVTAGAPTRYEWQKRISEELVRAATAEGVVRGACLRVPTLYGRPVRPGRAQRGAVHLLVQQALRGGRSPSGVTAATCAPCCTSTTRPRRSPWLPHLDRLAGRSWDVGAESGLVLRDLAELVVDAVARATGEPAARVVSVPPPADATPYDLGDAVVDPRPYAAVTGWHPARDLRDALDDVAGWLAGAPATAQRARSGQA